MPAAPKIDEFGLIARYFAPLADGYQGAFGLLDDAAVIGAGTDEEVVVTTDVLVEGVHFLGSARASDIARKALRVNLSDLAAMGARGVAYTLGLALPAAAGEDWVADFAKGLAEDQAHFSVTLIGGDTVATPGPLTVAIGAFGLCRVGGVVRRAGATPGDLLFVSGTIGDAVLGLQALRQDIALADEGRSSLVERYLLPQPRVSLGPGLIDLVHAMIDVSDGLVADLGHIADVSGVGAEIWLDRVPFSPAAKHEIGPGGVAEEVLICGGDDYELLFAAPADNAEAIFEVSRRLEVPVTEIGHVTTGRGVTVFDRDGRPMSIGRGGYRHF